jgi:hypothetical protein
MLDLQASVQRVVNRYLTKVAEEKSLNLQIDEKFKTWKGKNPNTKKEVGYWTVKGWKQLSKKQVSKDSDKAKLKEYALKAFKEFEKAIKGEGEGSDDKEVQKAISDMISKPNLGLPEKVFKGNKFALEVEKPSREEVKALAESLRGSFSTPGFNRSAIKQNLDVLGTDEWIKRSAMMVAKPLRAIGAKLSKDDDFKEAVREAKESNPEVAGAAKNLSANWTQSTIAPAIISSLTGTSGVSIGAGVKGLVTAGLSSAGVGGAVATAAPVVASLVVGAVMYKKLFHQRSKKAKGKLLAKNSDLPDSYDNLASDIYAGYATPESVEAEYNKKLDAILNDESMDEAEARKKIIELYEDFDTNARPSIDKGLYQLGATEGSGALDFLKRGAEEKRGTPILIKLLKLKDQYDAQDQIAKLMEEDPDETAKMIQEILSGKEEIPPGLIDATQGKKPQKKGNTMRNHNKMASRVAYRYMKQAGLLSKIVNFFSESPREKAKRPVYDVAKFWVTAGMYGTTLGEVSRELKLKGKDTAIIDVKGRKVKLSLEMDRVKMKDDGGIKGNIFVAISLTGVDENVPKRDLEKMLMQIVKETRLRNVFTSTPVEHPRMG